MSAIEKMIFLCGNENNLCDFLEISYDLNKDPRCADGEEHSSTWCNGWCEKIKKSEKNEKRHFK